MKNIFLRDYITAALFSTNDESTPAGGVPMDDNYSEGDIHPETLAKMQADCDKFQKENADDLSARAEKFGAHDFWFTRNGHGCGFWDGDWPRDIGERLTVATKAFGTFDLYIGDDKKIHG